MNTPITKEAAREVLKGLFKSFNSMVAACKGYAESMAAHPDNPRIYREAASDLEKLDPRCKASWMKNFQMIGEERLDPRLLQHVGNFRFKTIKNLPLETQSKLIDERVPFVITEDGKTFDTRMAKFFTLSKEQMHQVVDVDTLTLRSEEAQILYLKDKLEERETAKLNKRINGKIHVKEGYYSEEQLRVFLRNFIADKKVLK